MRYMLHLAAAMFSALAAIAEAQPLQIGLTSFSVQDAEHHRPLEGFIWYPTKDTSPPQRHHGNAVWVGIEAIEEAIPVEGPHPLAVLSHGMYGNAMNQSWLAAALARQGYVVAAIHHPGTSTWSRDPAEARQLWERPQDISRVIDHMLTEPEWHARIDPDRIFMAGHSLGGFTAMLLAGARYDSAVFKRFCDGEPGGLVCGIFDNWQIAQTAEDRTAMQADLSDPRIKRIAVFDLGGTQTFSTSSLANIDTPLLVFGAPRMGQETRIDLDRESRALVQALPADTVTYLEPEDLAHFDFLGVCAPKALDILRAEDPRDVLVCLEGGAARERDHQMITAEVLDFFAAAR